MNINSNRNFLNISEWRLTPYQILSLGIAALVLSGAFLLMLPLSSQSGESMSFVDALFTATSAVCVTGLVVVDTGNYFSLFGQLVIIFLIQCGALGFMTMATLMALLMRKKVHLRNRLIMQEALNQLTLAGIVKLVKYIIKSTLLIEFIGGTILAIRFYVDFGATGIYYGYWHAISAFCNAGFDIIGSKNGNLFPYVDDFIVNITLTSLIILGGLGFAVIADITTMKKFNFFALHTKIVLATTAFLVLGGMFYILLMDYYNPETLGGLSLTGKLLASYFQSVTLRTAGFATLPIGELTNASIFAMMILMFIGASPSSTGGGIKTTTFAVVIASIWSQIRGHEDTVLFYRKIPNAMIQKAYTFTFISAALNCLAIMLLTMDNANTESIPLFFEVISAFSTCGLSMGITPTLDSFSKYVLTIMMLIGRIGPVTFALALALKSQKTKIKYPEGKIMIG